MIQRKDKDMKFGKLKSKEKEMRKVYNKLVRDNIPDIIENSGKKCVTRILMEEDYIEALEVKLQEEVNEYQGATRF